MSFPYAFIPLMSLSPISSRPSCPGPPSNSRRHALQLFTLATTAAVCLPPPAQAEQPSLPGGAAQFSRLLAAQRQWSSLRPTLDGSRELSEEEWNSLRAYLRTIYGVSGDMDYLAKVWPADLRSKGEVIIRTFRQTVREMDKPAIQKDVGAFAQLHDKVTGNLESFFELLQQASRGDIPEEL